MFHPVFIVLAFLTVLGSGIAQGLWSNRWVPSRELQTAKERLEQLPKKIGNWELEEERQVSLKEQQIAGIVGYRSRVYVDRTTGHSVSVLLVCGKPASIAVHTPTVCFEGAGFRLTEPEQKETVATPDRQQRDSFWRARFQRIESGIPIQLQVYWGWSAGGEWAAAADARLDYWGRNVLFKLYVSRLVTEEDADAARCLEFLREAIPVLRDTLFEKAKPGSEENTR